MHFSNSQPSSRSFVASLTTAAAAAMSFAAPAAAQVSVTTSATVEIELVIRHTDITQKIITASGVRRGLGISIADYFNDDVYSTTLITDFDDFYDDTDPNAEDSTILFQVKKGGFIDWTDRELDVLWEMPVSPIFYKRIADNLDNLTWDPAVINPLNLPDLQSQSTVIFTSNDLFQAVQKNVALTNSAVMQVSFSNVAQPGGPTISTIEWDGTTSPHSDRWDSLNIFFSGRPSDTNWAGITSTVALPDFDDAVLFGGRAASSDLTVDLQGDRQVFTATFDRAESYLLDNTPGVNTLSLTNGDITVLDGSHTINSDVTLLSRGDWSVSAGDTLTVAGAIDGDHTLAHGGPGTVKLTGGGEVRRLTVYQGTVVIDGGDLDLTSTHTNFLRGAGNDTLIVRDGSTLRIEGGATLTTTGIVDADGSIVINRGALVAGYFRDGTTPTISITDPLSGGSALTMGGTADSTFGGLIQGRGSVVKTGSGTLTITNGNTYTGGTTVTAGTLMVNNTTGWGLGNGGVVVKSGATLGGTGRLDGTVQVDAGATFAPGASAGSMLLGSLNLDGVLEIEIGGTTQGTEYDRIELAGSSSTLKGILDVALINGFTPAEGDTFDIVHAFFGGLDVDFAEVNLPDLSAQGLAWQLNTDGSTLSLEVIPEPASLALLGLGGLTLLSRRRSSPRDA